MPTRDIILILRYIKIKVMKYIDKVKASIDIAEAIKALKDKESLRVTYGKDYKGNPKEYSIYAYNDYRDEVSYAIRSNALSSMNIDTVTATTMKAYSYDMMSQRTNYSFPLYELKLIK